MGNRAVIAFDSAAASSIGVYLHWNGGRDSIEGILLATRETFESEKFERASAIARFIENAAVFMGGSLSVYVDHVKNLDCDNWDNGMYIIDTSTLTIKGRKFFKGIEQGHWLPQEIAKVIRDRLNAAASIEG